MSETRRLSFPRPGRLLMRVYLVGLAQLVLVVFSLWLARSFIMDVPVKHAVARHTDYAVQEWAELRNDPVALQAALDRAGQRLGLQVTLRDVDGRLIASNAPPAQPLSAAALDRLKRDRNNLANKPPVITLPIPESGPLEAYAVILLPPPPGPPRFNTWLVVAVILLCTAITSIVFARTLATPLQRLAQSARDFGAGRLDARSGVRRRDELGAVAESFDEMAERITHLLRSQKELLANVSHELRTPLARIRVALDLASEGNAATARESLCDIAEDLSELERLVEDVLTAAKLDLSTGGAGGATPLLRLEQVDARVLLDKAAARFRSARPDHGLDVRVEGSLPTVEADPVMLRRVLDNLLDNAGKYSEAGSTVRMSARPDDRGLLLEVADSGIGIEPEDLPRIGTPFFRTDRSRARRTGGVGLGVALARRISEAHGGKLVLESQPGVGTTARVTLPAARAHGLPVEGAGVQAGPRGESIRHAP